MGPTTRDRSPWARQLDMARQNFNIPPAKQKIQTIIYGKDGRPILTIGMEEYAVQEPDGSMSVRKISQNLVLEDGQAWNPSMMMGNKPILLGVCEHCRDPAPSLLQHRRPSHGLVALHRAKLCADCGQLLCPRHQERCRDKKYRCSTCARKSAIKGLLRRLFFTYEGE